MQVESVVVCKAGVAASACPCAATYSSQWERMLWGGGRQGEQGLGVVGIVQAVSVGREKKWRMNEERGPKGACLMAERQVCATWLKAWHVGRWAGGRKCLSREVAGSMHVYFFKAP